VLAWLHLAHHSDDDFLNGSRAWSSVVGMARPPCAVISLRRRERWSPTVDAARSPHFVSRGGYCEWPRSGVVHSVGWSVFVAAASRQRIRHGGDPLGAVAPPSFVLLMLGHAEVSDDYKSVDCGWVQQYCFGFATIVEWSGVAMLISQSNRLELFGLRRYPNPTSLSCVQLS